MVEVFIETDLDKCKDIWNKMIPMESLADLWEFRMCFHNNFKRKTLFVIAKEEDEFIGLIPLSFIEESECYGYFPGETWKGKTWVEKNRIIAKDQNTLNFMFNFLKKNNIKYSLRYLLKNPFLPSEEVIDEVGYLFYPAQYGYDIQNYYSSFTGKSRKKVRKDIKRFNPEDITLRLNKLKDYYPMVSMSIKNFGKDSYFADERFRRSFLELIKFLNRKKYLRITTILVGKQPIAIDIGGVYNNVYTLFSGGTELDYLGIAKFINLHHIENACKERFEEVDFLCGDFSWKKLFHLTSRPLYLCASHL